MLGSGGNVQLIHICSYNCCTLILLIPPSPPHTHTTHREREDPLVCRDLREIAAPQEAQVYGDLRGTMDPQVVRDSRETLVILD